MHLKMCSFSMHLDINSIYSFIYFLFFDIFNLRTDHFGVKSLPVIYLFHGIK